MRQPHLSTCSLACGLGRIASPRSGPLSRSQAVLEAVRETACPELPRSSQQDLMLGPIQVQKSPGKFFKRVVALPSSQGSTVYAEYWL